MHALLQPDTPERVAMKLIMVYAQNFFDELSALIQEGEGESTVSFRADETYTRTHNVVIATTQSTEWWRVLGADNCPITDAAQLADLVRTVLMGRAPFQPPAKGVVARALRNRQGWVDLVLEGSASTGHTIVRAAHRMR